MTPLRSLSRDLFERRLWPIVAALAVVLVAVPALFLHPATSVTAAAPTGPATAPAAPAATPAAPGAPAPTSAGGATQPVSDPSIPPAVQALLRQAPPIEQGPLKGKLKDPFALAGSTQLSTTPPSASAPTTSALAAAKPSVSGGAPAPVATPSSSHPSSTPPVGSTPLAPASVPHRGPAPKPASQPDVRHRKSYDVWQADVRYGPDDRAPVTHDVARLRAFPNPTDPVAVFLGTIAGTHEAVFAVRSDARPTGSSACSPLPSTCLWLVVKPGAHVDLQVPDGKGYNVHERLTVVSVTRRTTEDNGVAMAAYERADAAGRCVLGVLAAYHFDDATGTLRESPDMRRCRYASAANARSASANSAASGTEPSVNLLG